MDLSRVDGKENTDHIIANYTLANYPIFNACKALRIETENDGWYIPENEYTAFFGYGKDAELGRINAKIKAIGEGVELIKPTHGATPTYYWLSSENGQYGAYCTSQGDNATSHNKKSNCKVRFILEF